MIRVAALDCALPENDHICTANKVEFYPTFVFFPPNSDKLEGTKLDEDPPSNYEFMERIADYVQSVQAPHWPSLAPFE